jgi:uncharacterized protein (TIGR03067 family)
MLILLEIGLSNALSASLLALVVAPLSKLCRQPAMVFFLWGLVLLKFVSPPLVRIPLSRYAALPETIARNDADDAKAISQVQSWLAARWPWLAAGAWMAGSGAWLTLALLRVRRFETLVRRAPSAPSRWIDEAARLSRLLGVRRPPDVRLVHGRLPPSIWALGKRPVVLLPAALWEQLTTEQRITLLAHEISHVKRGDLCLRWLELAVLALYWWHPVAWWARREIERAEERCCDAWVLWALPDLSAAYGNTLLDTIEFLAGSRPATPLVAPAFGQVGHLKIRLAAIVSDPPTPRLSWRAHCWVALAAVLVLPCSPRVWPTRAAARELDGSWIVTSVVQDGQPVPDDDVRRMRHVVAGNRHTFQFADFRFTGVHRLHPAERPKAIDIVLTGGLLDAPTLPESVPAGEPAGTNSACRGIYERRGDVLKLCVAFGRPRPDAFSSPAGSGRMLVVYRRANE